MPVNKPVLLIIGLAILGLLIFFSLEIAKHPKTEEIRFTFKEKAEIIYDNVLDSLNVSRRSPITTIELEERLRSNLPVPFASFKRDNWNWFWHLLYGKFSEDSQEWPKRTSQLTREEIQGKLIYYYQKPFVSFRQRQWDNFWQHILKGRVF